MSKEVIYIIITLTTVLWGASMLDIASIFGSVVSGFVGIFIYWKLRQAGYVE